MLQHILKWVFKIGEKEIHVFLDHDTPLDSIKEMSYQMMKHIGHLEDQVKAKQEAEKEKNEDIQESTECCKTEEIN